MPPWEWFRGDYGSWDAARANSVGYDDPLILRRIVEASRAVVRGDASFERDGVAFSTPFLNRPLLRALRLASSGSKQAIRVLDFGGGLGSAFWQHLDEITELGVDSWMVVEQPAVASAGRAEFQTGVLRFSTDLKEASGDWVPDLILASSSLQYVQDPRATIRSLVGLGARYFFVDRLPLLLESEDRLTVEHVPPEIGSATYPAWFLGERSFLGALAPDYELVERFETTLENGAPEVWSVFGQELRNQGFLFAKATRRTLRRQP